jgi:hypothetical protein
VSKILKIKARQVLIAGEIPQLRQKYTLQLIALQLFVHLVLQLEPMRHLRKEIKIIKDT